MYVMTRSWEKYRHSTKFLGSGSSTSSKAPQFENAEPALIERGKGCRVWDIDGNEYIDYRNGLGPVTLGYCVPEINKAISEQLEKGIVFGHPHVVEGEAAEMLVDVIPCAERVKFLKTGGEAIAACIKIARSATNKSRIVQCGYNGWINCLSAPGGSVPAGIANSQPLKGIPHEISSLHSSLGWADYEAWEKFFAENGKNIAAAVIASNYAEIEKGHEFFPFVRKLTEKYGALLIIDEIVTGFRLAMGGAHEYFDFMPDMAVFAKGFANGMPVSAYVGRGDLIDSAKGIGISSTFGGEALSLAAVKAVISFYKQNKVIEHLWETGGILWPQVDKLFKKYNISARIKGFNACPQIEFDKTELGSEFFRNSYLNGVSLYNVSYVNYSHKEKDIDETLQKLEKAIASI
ncbi:MAG: hypothetical protein A2020_02570 [Lentisphaerae bacterium GWF2_45_14]|nr:MAG: hypothetical protein A2020_02570 [Lentisphaerae bacterium GWF2_45_14]